MTLSILRSPLCWIFFGGLCYYAALPPLGLFPLAIAVPICWGIAIKQESQRSHHAYIYIAAFVFWLASIWWIACPHPMTSLGLIALSAYLSIYWMLFFTSARIAVHRFHIPLFLAIPICWIGCEYLRLHLLGGFSFCALEHAFYQYPLLIQTAAIGGSSFVGSMIMFFGALAVTCFSMPKYRHQLGLLMLVFVPLFCVVFLINRQLINRQLINGKETKDIVNVLPLDIVTLQGNKQVHLPPKENEAYETYKQFVDLTYRTINERKQKGKPLPDLIIFPETVCYFPALFFEGTLKPEDVELTEESARQWERELRRFVDLIETPILLGISTYAFKDDPDPLRLNSALLIHPQQEGKPNTMYRYDKIHLVMFGEYVPFAQYLPDDFILQTLCPTAQPGKTPLAMPIGRGERTIEASVNICFESSVSHLIRRHILTLRKSGHDPRVLINISNDGWFRFSQQIDQHLATHVFRAVENRMYYLSATNGGFSAMIDPFGKIEAIGKRGAAEAVMSPIPLKTMPLKAMSATIYQQYGDSYALVCAILMLMSAAFAFIKTFPPSKRD